MDNPNVINSLEALEALYDKPAQVSLAKEVKRLTFEYRKWILASPFLVIASSGAGGIDCSPRGDEAGKLLHVLDDQTLVIPDRRGNNRLDTLKNILTDSRVSLLFFLPGVDETLRVTGEAQIRTDPSLLQRFEHKDKTPATAIVVSISAVYFQCARALMRSKFWQIDHHAERTDVPTAGEMTRAALQGFDAKTYDKELRGRQKSTLY